MATYFATLAGYSSSCMGGIVRRTCNEACERELIALALPTLTSLLTIRLCLVLLSCPVPIICQAPIPCLIPLSYLILLPCLILLTCLALLPCLVPTPCLIISPRLVQILCLILTTCLIFTPRHIILLFLVLMLTWPLSPSYHGPGYHIPGLSPLRGPQYTSWSDPHVCDDEIRRNLPEDDPFQRAPLSRGRQERRQKSHDSDPNDPEQRSPGNQAWDFGLSATDQKKPQELIESRPRSGRSPDSLYTEPGNNESFNFDTSIQNDAIPPFKPRRKK